VALPEHSVKQQPKLSRDGLDAPAEVRLSDPDRDLVSSFLTELMKTVCNASYAESAAIY
jgi:hypothetical protein